MPRNLMSRLFEKLSNGNMGGDQKRDSGLAPSSGGGYLRVPSHGTISASTTSASLTADFEPHKKAFVEYPVEEEEDSQSPDEEEDFEKTRLHFQKQKQISIGSKSKYNMEMDIKGCNKNENLRTMIPFVKTLSSDSIKIRDEYEDDAHYKPQKINFMAQLLAAIAVSLGSMVVGFTTAYTSPALATMYLNTTISVTKDEGSWIGGLMPLAALVGGLLGGYLIVHLGRRNTILATAIPFSISWLIIATASNVYVIYAGRALGGLCVGIGSLSFPVYLGEALQPEVRGQLGLLPTALGNVGILVCFIAGKYLDWSALAYLGAVLPLPFLFLTFMVPETPRWYVTRGNHKGAKDALRWLRGKDADIDRELKDVIDSHEEAVQSSSNSSIFDLFRGNNIKPVFILLGLMFFQQMSGINAVIFYTVSIFQSAGSTIDENLSTIIVGIVNFASTFVATFLIDRLGRKILLYISSVAMVLTLGSLGAFFFVRQMGYDVAGFSWIPLVSFVVYVIGFSLGFGPIPWLMMGEILPGRIKGSAASFATAFNWTCTFIVTKTFNDIQKLIGESGTFGMFAAICFAGLFFTIFFVPETKGKSLEEIERKLNGKK